MSLSTLGSGVSHCSPRIAARHSSKPACVCVGVQLQRDSWRGALAPWSAMHASSVRYLAPSPMAPQAFARAQISSARRSPASSVDDTPVTLTPEVAPLVTVEVPADSLPCAHPTASAAIKRPARANEMRAMGPPPGAVRASASTHYGLLMASCTDHARRKRNALARERGPCPSTCLRGRSDLPSWAP